MEGIETQPIDGPSEITDDGGWLKGADFKLTVHLYITLKVAGHFIYTEIRQVEAQQNPALLKFFAGRAQSKLESFCCKISCYIS